MRFYFLLLITLGLTSVLPIATADNYEDHEYRRRCLQQRNSHRALGISPEEADQIGAASAVYADQLSLLADSTSEASQSKRIALKEVFEKEVFEKEVARIIPDGKMPLLRRVMFHHYVRYEKPFVALRLAELELSEKNKAEISEKLTAMKKNVRKEQEVATLEIYKEVLAALMTEQDIADFIGDEYLVLDIMAFDDDDNFELHPISIDYQLVRFLQEPCVLKSLNLSAEQVEQTKKLFEGVFSEMRAIGDIAMNMR